MDLRRGVVESLTERVAQQLEQAFPCICAPHKSSRSPGRIRDAYEATEKIPIGAFHHYVMSKPRDITIESMEITLRTNKLRLRTWLQSAVEWFRCDRTTAAASEDQVASLEKDGLGECYSHNSSPPSHRSRT